MAPSSRRATVETSVAARAADLFRFSTRLYGHPEIGYREFASVDAFVALLTANGHSAEVGVGGIPTAFRAHAGATDGPQVVITAEYDALPGVGHGCGHNVIAASSLGAFLAAADALAADPALPGGVTLLGTPAEEGGGGKELLIQAGALDGERAILDSSVALALTALEVLTDADLRDRAWAAFRAQGDPVRVSDLVPARPWPAFPHRPDHKEQP